MGKGGWIFYFRRKIVTDARLMTVETDIKLATEMLSAERWCIGARVGIVSGPTPNFP